MRMLIHAKGIKGSKASKDDPDALIYSVVEIDGVVMDRVTRVRVLSSGDNITTVMMRMIPGSLEYVAHDDDSWEKLLSRVNNPRKESDG